MMREQETYSDLTDLFTAEDRKLDPAPFVQDVMGGIRRKALMRRVLLGAVGLAGASVAAMQLPKLLSGWTGLDLALTKSVVDASKDASLLSTVDPLWLVVGGVVTLSLLAITTWERT
ncbi:hypothetical protein HY29_11750 [Hyphomonas beringensis]|uniref:Uncharacterized protein n=1 Tax=Hyphomonas beringensis TaxID=1280946 RepID=A0A062UCZ1_9PROT|nr:hypothetical protein [Hyphomonas beringensis]KCZ55583.1 hypothetical protein HY29_11750 [Hyphomonas beringensis]